MREVDQLILDTINKYSAAYNISSKFLLALIETESGFNPYAFRYEPNYRWVYPVDPIAKKLNITKESALIMQKCSYGLCQIMGAVFYEFNFIISQAEMYNIDTNIKCACMILGRRKDRYNISNDRPDQLYDVYNSGKINDKDGNQANIDRFMKNYSSF